MWSAWKACEKIMLYRQDYVSNIYVYAYTHTYLYVTTLKEKRNVEIESKESYIEEFQQWKKIIRDITYELNKEFWKWGK